MSAGSTGSTRPAAGGGPPAPAPLSRYRSRRQAQQKTQQPEPFAEDTPATPTIPSRYRHRSASLTRSSASPPEQTETPPPVPPLPQAPLSGAFLVTRSADVLVPPTHDFFVPGPPPIEENYRPLTRDSGKSFRDDDLKMPATRWVDEPTSFGGSQPDLRRRQMETPPLSPKRKTRSPLFSLFSRSRRATAESNAVPSPLSSVPASPHNSRTDMMRPTYIEAGGKGTIVPQIDAPVSASNAGDRRVVVKCMDSSITLPVKTNTTPTDILHSAANLISHKIKPETALVVESYLQYGLERRLRRYERVRDVMNSWDRDALNALVIIPSDMPENDRDLGLSSVPRSVDPAFSFSLQMYHCPRVGKWSKRIVSLLESGQMYAAKKPGAGPPGKDAVSLCHMSDFDIYSPTEHQMKKVLKPPKKYCYAVKSQQKSSVFPTGENFVHFFCTDDAAIAKRFHDQVHGWRSWYLVNRKTDFQPTTSPTGDATMQGGGGPRRVGSARGPGHRARQSVDSTPYAIGTFKPLIDMDEFTQSLDQAAATGPQQPLAHETQQRRLSRGSYHHHRRSMSAHSPVESDFNSNGLLGSMYEERKEALRLRDDTRVRDADEGPFTQGPSLLNRIAAPQTAHGPFPQLNNNSSNNSAAGITTLERRASSRYRQPQDLVSRQRSTRRASSPASSVRTTATSKTSAARRPDHMPPPLLDIEAVVAAEPATWREEVSRNRGHGVRAPAGVPLVDLATGGRPAQPQFIPASGTFARSGATTAQWGPGAEVDPAATAGADTLVGMLARSQSTAASAAGGAPVSRSMSMASRRGPSRRFAAEDAPPLPAGGTLLARYEAQQRVRSGTVR